MFTAELSAEVSARARKNATLILQRLASVGQAALAEALGVSESTISRWKDGDLEKIALTLAVLGIKIVPLDYRCVDPRKLDALLALAEDGFDALRKEINNEPA